MSGDLRSVRDRFLERRQGSVIPCVVLVVVVGLLVGAKAEAANSGSYRTAVKGRRYGNTIGLYDNSRIHQGWKRTKEEEAQLKALREEYQKEVDALSEKARKEEIQYAKDKAALSADVRAARERQIQSRYEQYRQLIDKRQKDIDDRQNRALRSALPEIVRAVDKVGAELGCTVVERRGGDTWDTFLRKHKNVPPVVDITPLVIEELNKNNRTAGVRADPDTSADDAPVAGTPSAPDDGEPVPVAVKGQQYADFAAVYDGKKIWKDWKKVQDAYEDLQTKIELLPKSEDASDDDPPASLQERQRKIDSEEKKITDAFVPDVYVTSAIVAARLGCRSVRQQRPSDGEKKPGDSPVVDITALVLEELQAGV